MSANAAVQRVLILAPTGRDAELICTHLEKAGMPSLPCNDIETLCDALEEGAGALMFTEEALVPEATQRLARSLDKEPAWSEVPIVILIGLPDIEAKPRSFRELGRRTNVTLVDRPVRIQSLISTAQSALRARMRQIQVRDLMEKLEDRVHERDRFLAILGHELRNPLGAILLASQMVDEGGHIDRDHVRLIERQSRNLTRIVNDLLDLSRVVSGKIVIKPKVIDIRVVAQQTVESLGEFARAHGVEVRLDIPDEPVHVSADPVRADQILNNILTNAIKYTPEGGHVLVSITCENGVAILCVIDDGVGIAPNRIGTIFELFAQAENAIGRSQGGMGIGLALVKNLVELHGGTIEAHSDGVGQGCEITVRLPLAEATDEMPETTRPASAAPPVSRHIVIVEDNADVRELLRLKLRRLGHTVDVVSDGVAGVNAIIEIKPHIALIDIGLPRLDGYHVAMRVREQLGHDIVLVAVSGFGQPEDKRKAIEAGFDDHITKPADVNDIEGLLARYG